MLKNLKEAVVLSLTPSTVKVEKMKEDLLKNKGVLKVASKEEKPLTVNDCIKEQYNQAKILKRKYKKFGWNIKVKRRKFTRRFYPDKSLLKAGESLFSFVIVKRGNGRDSQKWLARKRK